MSTLDKNYSGFSKPIFHMTLVIVVLFLAGLACSSSDIPSIESPNDIDEVGDKIAEEFGNTPNSCRIKNDTTSEGMLTCRYNSLSFQYPETWFNNVINEEKAPDPYVSYELLINISSNETDSFIEDLEASTNKPSGPTVFVIYLEKSIEGVLQQGPVTNSEVDEFMSSAIEGLAQKFNAEIETPLTILSFDGNNISTVTLKNAQSGEYLRLSAINAINSVALIVAYTPAGNNIEHKDIFLKIAESLRLK